MEITDLPKNKKIILFDGVCNLCNSSILYLIKKDKNDLFRFANLESEIGKKIVQHIGLNPKQIDCIVLYEPGIAYYYKSSAILEITNSLGLIFSFATLFRILPNAIRDKLYDYIAANRYKWYGKQENCSVPDPAILEKFLD